MQQPSISPGWALFVIFILWGLAGALDQPIEDEPEPSRPTLFEHVESPVPTVHLQCELDATASSPAPAGRSADGPRAGPVTSKPGDTWHDEPRHASQQRVLRCLVIGE